MTVRRTSYSPSNVIRFLPIFDALIKQIKEQRITGAFVPTTNFPDMKVTTIQNRLTDALKWLRDNADIPQQTSKIENYKPEYTALDYQMLRTLLKCRMEAKGIRLMIQAGFSPGMFLKSPEDISETKTSAGWKIELNTFLNDTDAKVKIISNCIFKPEDEPWIKQIVEGVAGTEYYINGDKLTVVKA